MSHLVPRLSFDVAADLAARISAELAPVCERIEIAGSIRRLRPTVGDIELLAIPKFAPSLLPDVPGVSLLDMALVAMVKNDRLVSASANQGGRLKRYYIPALWLRGHDLKLEINVSDAERWPVELAIKTGPVEFSKKLVTYRRYGGWLPGHWRIEDGWKVWEGEKQIVFESERQFIEVMCGQWIPPELRD